MAIKDDFTFEEQVKIWVHYMVRQCYLNAVLKIEMKNPYPEFPIRSFDSFLNENDDRVSSGIIGYYNRFKKEIFK